VNKKTYLICSGVVFGVMAIGQFMRLIFQVPVQAGTFSIPVWPSAIGFVVTLSLCIWALRLASK
jgi:hypothetical protein